MTTVRAGVENTSTEQMAYIKPAKRRKNVCQDDRPYVSTDSFYFVF